MRQGNDMFMDLEAMALDRQFRMSRLQALNWGTFSDLHDIPIAEEGFLFVGRSGSGKSTLLDAISSLLVPPQWISFNTAAREGDGGRYDRNLASYVRGAWADKKDAESGEIATHYLRTQSTWSALALTFSNNNGKFVSLVQLYWLRGNSNQNTDVRKHFMIAERPFDIASELGDFDLDIRSLKLRLDDIHHYDKFRPYGERFRRLLSIDTEMALKLLHKTQSAKNLGDLNVFLREFMLESPKTFEVAGRLVNEFAELDAAHQAVVTARRQVETLTPAREAHGRVEEIDGALDELISLSDAMDSYRDRCRVRLLERECRELHSKDEALAGEEQQRRRLCDNYQSELEILHQRHREQGGGRIEELERQQRESERRRDDTLSRRGVIESACRQLEWSMPDNPHACAEMTATAREELEQREEVGSAAESERDRLRDDMRAVEQEFAEVNREVKSMLAQPSNIPARMLALRSTIADALGMNESELPFAGELIEVKAEESAWQGAVERVLHGFALSLLVDERRYSAVSKYVNETHLGGRLVYYRTEKGAKADSSRVQPASLVNKLNLKEGPFRAWLQGELTRRFDYVCVDNLLDFRNNDRALTREGQVRHNRSRHEKDDRYDVANRSRWVLGFDNGDKLRLYQQRAGELGAEIGTLQQKLKGLEDRRRQREQRLLHCQTLVNVAWHEIDVATVLDRIQAVERQLREIREGNRELQALGEEIDAQKRKLEQARQHFNDTLVERQTLNRQLNEYQLELRELDDKTQGVALETAVEQALDGRFAVLEGSLTLKNLDSRRNRVERTLSTEKESLNRERSGLVRVIEKCFADFRREWPMESADLDDTLASASEYFKLLTRLEKDGLPQHEARFFDLLKEQSTENLAALNTHLSQARKQIYERMEIVNAGLAEAEFNPGTHLQIEVADRYLPDVRQFREQVIQVLEHAWQMDREEAESRFSVLRELVHHLSGTDNEQMRWRNLVLDVRQHVEFIGRELDEEKREMEVYRSGAGKSGGQREKLATTCLAAALRYQLGGSDDDLPVYASVVLDEAFGKADNEFTELAMNIFKKFGFQMIVATPLKSVMTLEPFIGGACFVDIAERKRSATLQIEYDIANKRLRLPKDVAHGEIAPA